MTNRTAVHRAGRLATLAAVVTLLLGVMPVHAASAVQIEVRPMLGGRYEVGGWMALAVSLFNDGEPTDGFVSAETAKGAVRRHVEMPAGARKVVMLYVQPDAFQRRITVEYTEPNGTATAEVEVSVLQQASGHVAVVGDATGTLRPQLIGANSDSPEPIAIGALDIPERPEPLGALSGIVWAGDSSGLNEAQRRSIERWVADGGELIVLGGPDWQARTAGLSELLPVDGLNAIDDVPQAELAAWAGSQVPASEAATVSTGALRDDARSLVTADDGTVLAAMRAVGAGQVVFIGTDLATPEHRGWDGAPQLWARLLPNNAIEQFMGGGFPVQEEIDNAISGALNTLPSLEVPPAELLLGVIAGYILLIGPVSYVVLRRADRREMAWVTAPLLVVLFSASSYGIGRTLKGSDVIVNQISLVRSSSAGTSATVESYAGIYSPDRSTYDVTVEADALLGRVSSPNMQGIRGSTDSGVAVEQGDPAHLRGLSIGVFGFEGVHAIGVVDHEPALSLTWRSEEGRSIGTVTNVSDQPISDVAWISTGGGEMVGDLEPGASAEFTVPSNNFNGSSASDQVYGFGGFENPNEQQRQVQLRRQVIDALVGYGGFPPGMVVSGPNARGPYLIGWSEGEGPLPVIVDDLAAQRYDSVVEVLAARPTIGTGEVTVQPLQMVVNVSATGGDASSAGPGMVNLGNGSATYSVALPLEAAGLSPTQVSVVAGPDPSALTGQGGGFGGFWPEGYTVEVRNPQSGEWVMLGDLSERSEFAIDDPSTALDAAGRLQIRVSGTLDANFGMPTVFMSARVTGVIGQ